MDALDAAITPRAHAGSRARGGIHESGGLYGIEEAVVAVNILAR